MVFPIKLNANKEKEKREKRGGEGKKRKREMNERETVAKPFPIPFNTKKRVENWSLHDVGEWLQSVGFYQYRDDFVFNEIDGKKLLALSQNDVTELMQREPHREKMVNFLGRLREGVSGSLAGSLSDSSSTSTLAPESPRGISVKTPIGAQANETVVKCIFKNKIAHFTLTNSDSFETYQRKIRGQYGRKLFSKYKDHEGDLVTVRNTRDIKELYDLAKISKVTLILYSIRPPTDILPEEGAPTGRSDFKTHFEEKRKRREREKAQKEKAEKEKEREREREKEKEKERLRKKERREKRSKKAPVVPKIGGERGGGERGTMGHTSTQPLFSTTEVLESFVEAVVTIDHRGEILFFNGAAEDMFQYDREEVVGENVTILMNEYDAKYHNSYLRSYRQHGGGIMGKGKRVSAKDKSGKLFDVWLSLSETNLSYTAIIQQIQEGPRDRIVPSSLAKDCSSSTTAPDFVELFSFFNLYPDAVVVMSEEGFIQYANKKTSDVFGHENLVGQPASLICPALCSDKRKDLLSDYLSKVQPMQVRTLPRMTSAGSLLSGGSSSPRETARPNTARGEGGEQSHHITPFQSFHPGAALGLEEESSPSDRLLDEKNQRQVLCYTRAGKILARVVELSHQTVDGRFLFTVIFKPPVEGEDGVLGASSRPSNSNSSSVIATVNGLQIQRELIASLVIPAMIIDEDCSIQEINSSALQLFGFPLSEVLGRNVSMLMLPETREAHTGYVKSYAKLKRGRNPDGTSDIVGKGKAVLGISKTGIPIAVTLSVSMTETENGKNYFTGILQPILEDDAGDQSEIVKQQASVLNSLVVAACIITHDSKIRAFNAAAEEMFGYQFRELRGKDVSILIPAGELKINHHQIVKDFFMGKRKKEDSLVVGKGREVIGRRKDGKRLRVSLSVTEANDDDLGIYTGIFTRCEGENGSDCFSDY